MASTRQPKKSESIEVRLSHETKAAFMEHCRQAGRTASEAIRLFIDGEVTPCPDTPRRRAPHWRTAMAIAAGAALGMGAAVPSLAHATQTSRAAFQQLDRNHDGVLSYEEFRAR